LRCVCAKSPMHQRPFSVSEHPPARGRPATCPGVSQHAGVHPSTTTEKESRGLVRGTEESDRAASPAPAEIEVCAGTVLPGCGCAEHQTTGAVSQPAHRTTGGQQLETREEFGSTPHQAAIARCNHRLFQHPRLIASVDNFSEESLRHGRRLLSLLLQPRVLGFGIFEDGDVGVGVFPEREEIWYAGVRVCTLAGVQHRNLCDRAGCPNSCHPATSGTE